MQTSIKSNIKQVTAKVENLAKATTTAFDEIDNYRVGRLSKSKQKYIRDNLDDKVADELAGLTDYEAVLFDKATSELKRV